MASIFSLEYSKNPLVIDKLLSSFGKVFNSREILDESGSLLLNRIRTRFLEEKDPDGKLWIPSKAGKKRRGRGGTGTLFKTGRLFRSIQLSGTGDSERVISSDVPYGRFHQEGLGQVRRVFLGFNEEDAKLIERVLEIRLKRQNT